MKLCQLSVAAITSLVLAISSGCVSRNAAQKDLDALQGTWELDSAESHGQDVTKESQNPGFISFLGDAWVQNEGTYRFCTLENSHIKLDPFKSPKAFDHVHSYTAGVQTVSFTYPGIYEIDGDSLKLCYDVDLKNRPTEFTTKAGSGYFLAILKRTKR